jgi:transcriptional regulator with XRE-family HTH domain
MPHLDLTDDEAAALTQELHDTVAAAGLRTALRGITLALASTIGTNVRVLRAEHGWSREQLAIRADISVQTVRNIETGFVMYPQSSTVWGLAKAFAISLEQLNTPRQHPNEEFSAPDLPDLPTQAPGPHFELTKKGIIDFVPPEALDRDGNNVRRLRQLHPTLRDLARELAEALGTGNIPHANLGARIGEYRKQVDQALDKIDFALLYVEGVRLANAEKAAIEKIAEGELPPFGETDREALDTLLGLHGTFMVGTIAGAELIDAEQRYRRRPAEEREYRVAAVDFAASLQNKPDVIAPNAAAFVLGAAEQIGQGANLGYSDWVTVTVYAIFAEKAPVWAALPELVPRRSCAGDKARPLTGAIGAPSGSSLQCHVARGCRRSVLDRNELAASSTAWRRRYGGNPRRSTTGMLRVR